MRMAMTAPATNGRTTDMEGLAHRAGMRAVLARSLTTGDSGMESGRGVGRGRAGGSPGA